MEQGKTNTGKDKEVPIGHPDEKKHKKEKGDAERPVKPNAGQGGQQDKG